MPDEIYHWLDAQAQARHIHATFHKHLVREDGGWFYIPVHIADALDAYDKAALLQEIEDTWNEQEPTPDHQLLLIPAAN